MNSRRCKLVLTLLPANLGRWRDRFRAGRDHACGSKLPERAVGHEPVLRRCLRAGHHLIAGVPALVFRVFRSGPRDQVHAVDGELIRKLGDACDILNCATRKVLQSRCSFQTPSSATANLLLLLFCAISLPYNSIAKFFSRLLPTVTLNYIHFGSLMSRTPPMSFHSNYDSVVPLTVTMTSIYIKLSFDQRR